MLQRFPGLWVLSCAGLLGCATGPHVEPLPVGLATRDPVADARAAIAHGDHRLLGYATGVATLVPGVPTKDITPCVQRLGLRVAEVQWDLVGTPSTAADSARAASAERRVPIVMQYLVSYNRAVLHATATMPGKS